jgi:transcriptional regulator with XRE-family HTH domain
MTLGQKIKEQRLRLNLSQEYVAKFIGTSKQAIYKYENEIVTNIPTDKIQALATLFNVTPAYLMGWEEQEKPNSPDETNLTEGERMLLELFRQIPEEKQQMALQMLRAALIEK